MLNHNELFSCINHLLYIIQSTYHILFKLYLNFISYSKLCFVYILDCMSEVNHCVIKLNYATVLRYGLVMALDPGL